MEVIGLYGLHGLINVHNYYCIIIIDGKMGGTMSPPPMGGMRPAIRLWVLLDLLYKPYLAIEVVEAVYGLHGLINVHNYYCIIIDGNMGGALVPPPMGGLRPGVCL